MKAYLPFLGEFGGELLKVVPQINGAPNPKIVYCEKGKGTLYPSATKLIEIERVPESTRETFLSRNTDKIFEEIRSDASLLSSYKMIQFVDPLRVGCPAKWFVPEAEGNYGFDCDVVLFPRKRSYRAILNWNGWEDLVIALQSEGLSVFAAGHRDSSVKLPCQGIWDFDKGTDLDVTIHAIKHSKLRIGALTALHVLSMMCGKSPIVLTTEDGRMHPKVNNKPNLSYLEYADHLNVGQEVLSSFDIQDIVNSVKRKGFE